MANIKISELDELGVISFQDEIPIVDVSEKETKKVKIHQFSEAITPLTPMPIGSIFAYGGETAPDGYLFANGQEVSRTEYAELFEVYGETYGFGDYETTFNVPNLCGKVIVGFGEALDSTGELRKFENLGEQGGEFRHQLTIGEMPSHTHNTLFSRNSIPTGTNAYAQVDILGQGAYGTVSGYTGQGQEHNNMQPYLVTNYIIKAKNDSKTFTDTVVEQTEEFNQHVNTKLNEYNQNASDKTDVFNLHVETKTTEFNTNASEKIEEFNSNAENKVNEFNSNIDDLIQEVEDCYNNMLTNEVEGTNIYVDDSVNARVLELGIDGNSYQETRSGKNLFPIKNLPITKDGVTMSEDANGNIVLNGTPSITSGAIEFIFDNISLTSGTYTSSVANKKVGINLIFNGGNINGGLNLTFTDTKTTVTNTISSDTTTDQVVIGVRYDVGTLNNFILNPQVEKGSSATSFEQYGASPSPDYPSEVEVVKGYNLFDYSLMTGTSNINFIDMKLNPNTYYTLSTNIPKTYDGSNAYIFLTAKEHGYTTSGNGVWLGQTRYILSDENGYISIGYRKDNSINSLEDYWYQLNEGTIPKPYVPYKNIGIKTIGKNLFDKNSVVDNSSYLGSIGGVVQATTNIATFRVPIFEKKSDYITISANKNSAAFRVLLLDENNITLSDTRYTTLPTTINTSNCENIAIFFAKDTISKEDNIQIEEGTIATPYEPYQENITYIDLQDNEICKYGDAKDNYNVATGILTKRIGKVVLDGSETITTNSTTNGEHPRFRIINFAEKNVIVPTANNVKAKIVSNYFETITTSGGTGTYNCIEGISLDTSYNLDIYTKDITTLEEFKAWLSENPVTVYYQLETPYEVNLGKIEIPKTINHVTNINLLATLESNMKLKYIRSTNVVIDNLAKAIVALGGEV